MFYSNKDMRFFSLVNLFLIIVILFSLTCLPVAKKLYQCSLLVLTLSFSYNLLSIRTSSFFSNFLLIAGMFGNLFAFDNILYINTTEITNITAISLFASVSSLFLSALFVSIFSRLNMFSSLISDVWQVFCARIAICLFLDSIIMWSLLCCFTQVNINEILHTILCEIYIRAFLSAAVLVCYSVICYKKASKHKEIS